ncbi:hypothetical protein [Nesterenkonia rhizosphaerae]|uniref:Uncharacterized protein n=1 Tax=Nesterenkonia rhizosphaerae TaxID=1348272 RepID=A0ABP9FTU7_9MICC
MTDLQRVHNPGPYEVVYTSAGHQIAGHTSAVGDLEDPTTYGLVESGQLIAWGPIESAESELEESEPEEPTEPEETATNEPQELQAPPGNAGTEVWADYAVAIGIPASEVAGLGRSDIQALITEFTANDPAQEEE